MFIPSVHKLVNSVSINSPVVGGNSTITSKLQVKADLCFVLVENNNTLYVDMIDNFYTIMHARRK